MLHKINNKMLEKTNRNELLKHPVQCNMLPYFACSLDLMWKNDTIVE